jgi:Na+-translocating ferredoxin:NAD+ oxidoreductase RnfD subunit
MGILYSILVFLHVVGAAMLVGIWIGNMKKPTVHPRQFDGAALQLLTGVAMMGVLPFLPDADPNYAKLGIKLVIALVVGVLAFLGARKYKANEPVTPGLAHAVGGLALLNIALATLWN